ncbi:MAG: restriction endonuclease subunit S [Halorientalis sp.]
MPEDWETVPLGEVADKVAGTKPEKVKDENEPELEPYVTAEAYSGEITSYADPESGKKCNSSDVLLVWDGSVGKVMTGYEGVLGSTMAALRFDEELMDPEFAYFYLHESEDKIASLAEGTTILHLPRDFMEIFEVPLPPLQEQRAISEFLNNIEFVAERSEKIKTEVEELKQEAVNQLLRNGTEEYRLKEIRIGPRTERLPEPWEVQNIDEISLDGKEGLRGGPPGGKIKNKYRSQSGYKIYAQENVISRNFDQRSDYIPEERYEKVKSAATKPGDILITTEGSIGRAAVVPENAEPGIVNNHLARLRVNQEIYNPYYIAEVIDASHLVESQIKSLSNNSGRPGLNLNILREFRIPVPSKEEQSEIVRLLGSFDSKRHKENVFAENIEELEDGLRRKFVKGELRF